MFVSVAVSPIAMLRDFDVSMSTLKMSVPRQMLSQSI